MLRVIQMKTRLGLFILGQCYQVAMNDSWRWFLIDFFMDRTHHPLLSLLCGITVLYDVCREFFFMGVIQLTGLCRQIH